MRTVNIKGKVVTIYDDIQELPIRRFQKYGKMLLIDAGIGSDLAGFDKRIRRALIYLGKNEAKKAAIELENMRQSVFFIQSGLSPKYLAFACLVKSIDGRERNDLSDDALQRLTEELGDMTDAELTDHLDSVKKKIDGDLKLYFPGRFDDGGEKECYDQLKRRTQLILENIVDGKTDARESEIDRIADDLATYYAPEVFVGKGSAEIRYDREFEDLCLLLSSNLHVQAKEYTVMEFYNALEYLETEAKKRGQARKGK